MSKKSKRKVGRVVRRELADGTIKEYRYGSYKPKPSAIARDSIDALVNAYKRSPAWDALAIDTKRVRSIYLRHIQEIGQIQVKSIKRRDIIAIRDVLAKTSGNGAAEAFVRAMSVLFSWAVDNDWLEFTPVHKIKRLPSGHLPAWTNEQAAIALTKFPEQLRRVVILGLYTGQRRGDLCAASWSDYDGRTLRFTQAKTGAQVILLVHPDLKSELDAWHAEAKTDAILESSWGRRWAPNSLSRLIPLAMEAAGLPSGLNVHGMRKLFAAGMADAGATIHEIGAHTGHKTLSMIQLYTKSADQRKLAEGSVSKIQTHKKTT